MTNQSKVAQDLSALKHLHDVELSRAIEGPDERGAWVEPFFASVLGDAFPLVLDANVLRECIGKTAKSGNRTVLTSIANGRGARIFCSRHIIDELEEHLEEWAEGHGVSPAAYRSAFNHSYRPLLRIVSTQGLETMLLSHERPRIERLRLRDPDDIPTAILALTIGAVAVTMDGPLWEAIYDDHADTEALRAWLSLLMNVGNQSETQKAIAGAAALLTASVYGSSVLLYRGLRVSPWLVALTALGLGIAASRVSRSTYDDQWATLKQIYRRFNAAFVLPHAIASKALGEVMPPVSTWEEIVDTLPRQAALGRACLYMMARSRCSPIKASELANRLPGLRIGQNASRIGIVLRQFPAFFEPYSMQWQVGQRSDR